jgi:hypothetical protein
MGGLRASAFGQNRYDTILFKPFNAAPDGIVGAA